MSECNHIFVLRIAGKKAPVTVPIDDESVCPYCEINRLKVRVSELEQALERIADMSVDIHGTIPPSIRIAREALGRG